MCSIRASRLLATVAIAVAAFGVRAEVANRGLLDSVVDTLAGGNSGHGLTARQAPLQFTDAGGLLIAAGGGTARDTAGNIYVTENHRLLRIDTAGVITVIAGSEFTPGFRGEGELAGNALFSNPRLITTDPNNNIYVLDVANNRIRQISAADGIIRTVVGNGIANPGFIEDVGRLGVDVRLNAAGVVGIAVNAAGDIFYADNTRNVIYRVDAVTKVLSIVAGNGNFGVTPSGAAALANPLNGIQGLALLSTGDLVYTETNAVRQINVTTDGLNVVIAGLLNGGTPPSPINGGAPVFPDDPARTAVQPNGGVAVVRFPRQIAVDGANIIFWDNSIAAFRLFTVGGVISTVFGETTEPNATGFRGDGIPAVAATTGVIADDPRATPVVTVSGGMVAAGGVVTFVDLGNNLVRQFTIGGNVATLAGAFSPFRFANTGDFNHSFLISDNAPLGARGISIDSPSQLARDAAGNIYFNAVDFFGDTKIYRFDPAANTVAVVAGNVFANGFPAQGPGDGGVATGANLTGMGTQVGVAADGSVFFADTNPAFFVSSHTIRRIDPAGVLTTVGGIPGVAGIVDPDADPLGAGGTTRNGKNARAVLLNSPEAVLVSGTDLIIADSGNSDVVRIDATGVLSTIITAGAVISPSYLARDAAGNTYVASRFATTVDMIDPAGVVTNAIITVAGNVRGLGVGTNGALEGLYIAHTGGADTIELYELPPALTGGTVIAGIPGVLTGMQVTGNVITYTSSNDTISRLTSTVTVTGGVPAGGPDAPVVLAGEFFTLQGNGGINLNTGFTFGTNVPVGILGTDILVGDDGANQFRRVTPGVTPPQSTATVLGGTGFDSGSLNGENTPATTSTIFSCTGLAVGPDGAVYYSDSSLGVIRRARADGIMETFAGIPGRSGFSGNGLARLDTVLSGPTGLAFNAAGELQFNESSNCIVRRVQADGTVILVAGSPLEGGYQGDGYIGTMAKFSSLNGALFTANGDYMVADGGNNVVRVIPTNGIVDTLAGNSNGHNVSQEEAPALEAELGFVHSITVDTAGKLYSVAIPSPNPGTIIRTAAGFSRAVVGVGGVQGFNGDGLPGLRTLVDNPEGVLYDPTLGLLFTDTGNHRLRRVTNLAEASNSPPQAVIAASPDRLGQAPLKVRFDGSLSVDADGDIVSYRWDFGDGSTGDGAIIEHVFAAADSYTVTLTVTDTQGQASSIKTTVFAATPLILSGTTGKGSFKVAFGPKAGTKDSFSISMKGVDGLTNVAGLPAKVVIGSFTVNTTVGGKGIKLTDKITKLIIDADPKKKTVALSIKGVALANTFIELGVLNANTVAPGKPVIVPVVINVNNGALVVGDNFLFIYKGKFNSGASGKFAQ